MVYRGGLGGGNYLSPYTLPPRSCLFTASPGIAQRSGSGHHEQQRGRRLVEHRSVGGDIVAGGNTSGRGPTVNESSTGARPRSTRDPGAPPEDDNHGHPNGAAPRRRRCIGGVEGSTVPMQRVKTREFFEVNGPGMIVDYRIEIGERASKILPESPRWVSSTFTLFNEEGRHESVDGDRRRSHASADTDCRVGAERAGRPSGRRTSPAGRTRRIGRCARSDSPACGTVRTGREGRDSAKVPHTRPGREVAGEGRPDGPAAGGAATDGAVMTKVGICGATTMARQGRATDPPT